MGTPWFRFAALAHDAGHRRGVRIGKRGLLIRPPAHIGDRACGGNPCEDAGDGL